MSVFPVLYGEGKEDGSFGQRSVGYGRMQVFVFYNVIAAMYCTVCKCPTAIRISRSYFLVRSGHIFFQILEAGEVVSVMESDISRLRYSFGVIPVCFLN